MKASTVIVLAAGLATSMVSAQLDQIPQCALSCALTSLGSTGCGTTDISCICKAQSFIAALTPCVQAACSAADVEKTIAAAETLCASAGVSLSIPTATGSSMASTSTAPPATTEMTTTEMTTSATVVTSSVYVVPNATTTFTSVAVPSSNTTVTTGSPSTTGLPSPTPTGNAAGRNGVAIGGLAAVLAFAAALL